MWSTSVRTFPWKCSARLAAVSKRVPVPSSIRCRRRPVQASQSLVPGRSGSVRSWQPGSGCTTIIAVDTKPNRLTLARELGATHTLNALETDVVEEVQHITGGGATFTLETTGRPQVLRQAVDALAILGTCVVVGAPPAGTEASFDVNNLFVFGRTIRGIVQGDSVPDVFIPRLIDLYFQGRFRFDGLVRFYPLEDINAAVQDAEQGTTIKPVLRMESVERKKK